MLKEYKSVYNRNPLRRSKLKENVGENVSFVTPVKWSKTYYMRYDEAEKLAKENDWLIPFWEELSKAWKRRKISDWKKGKYITASKGENFSLKGVKIAMRIIESTSGKKLMQKDFIGGIEKSEVRFIVSYIDENGTLIKKKGDSFIDRLF
jgi:hypothetical protein